ncbi:aldolase catalytic domain-containing protein [Dysgonomonas sp. GY617]|uniref:aldolase catalytic domain-containing protein n=1 Tax=Dysgonomonas sp. GY617 TaxID=2780420 RepID=UPI00188421C3|nr:aldolase catalytic domain-containing protein [Dysgonomonas sp. GY617]MBF0576530.1 aldolase catalytic domain-containing protein [Dysgonomonas sp. GY617]
MKILDCTLRDGGYYTNWDFDKKIVDKYIETTNILPIDYLEIGYRNMPSSAYLGKYAYCPIYEVLDIRAKSFKKLSIMLNEKDVRPANLNILTEPLQGIVDMVRMAIDPKNITRALILAEALKRQGFEVGFNVMYMSKWLDNNNFIQELGSLSGIVDVFCMVDSFGGIIPHEVEKIINLVRSRTDVPIGFHGHNNLELGLINTLVAIDNHIDFIDATVLGMGRGAGNLKMELFLTYLSKHCGFGLDFNALGNLVSTFHPLFDKYQWGTNLPYMISGANSFPQKDVMDMVSNRLCSFNSIVRVLDNKKANVEDNEKFPLFKDYCSNNVLIVGGGENVEKHIDGIQEFIKSKNDITIIHASSKNASHFKNINAPQMFCLVGNEGQRIEEAFKGFNSFVGTCILPPFPRKMGTEVPFFVHEKTFELGAVEFIHEYEDSCTSLALQIALDINAKNVFIVGYDGYPDGLMTSKEKDLTTENEYILLAFCNYYKGSVVSLTPTVYNLKVESLYQNL